MNEDLRAVFELWHALHPTALAICEQQGIDDQHLAGCVGTLSWLYDLQGKYKQAEPLRHRALMIDEKSLRISTIWLCSTEPRARTRRPSRC